MPILSAKEVESLKRKLRRAEVVDREKRARDGAMASYAKKSAKKIKKSQSTKAKDIFKKGRRTPGSAYSRNG